MTPHPASVLERNNSPGPCVSLEIPKTRRHNTILSSCFPCFLVLMVYSADNTREGALISCMYVPHVSSVIYLPVLCIAEVMIKVVSHRIQHGWVLYSAPGESVLHHPHPPRPSIHALCDAIVWVSAGVMSIRMVESSFDLRRTDVQAQSFSLLAVLLSHRRTHLQQGVLHIPQHPAQARSHCTYRGKTKDRLMSQ